MRAGRALCVRARLRHPREAFAPPLPRATHRASVLTALAMVWACRGRRGGGNPLHTGYAPCIPALVWRRMPPAGRTCLEPLSDACNVSNSYVEPLTVYFPFREPAGRRPGGASRAMASGGRDGKAEEAEAEGAGAALVVVARGAGAATREQRVPTTGSGT